MYIILVEIPEGWGEGNSGEEGGGGLLEISSMVGVWMFSGTT